MNLNAGWTSYSYSPGVRKVKANCRVHNGKGSVNGALPFLFKWIVNCYGIIPYAGGAENISSSSSISSSLSHASDES